MKRIELLLTDPCTKQWSEIERADGKHHCGQCKKNIFDLTGKSDEELADFFQNAPEHVCARLLSSQLNRNILPPSSKVKWHLLMPLAFGALIANPSLAQNLKPAMANSQQLNNVSPVQLQQTLAPLTFTVTGKVIANLNGNPLAGVKIREKGHETVLATTDTNGKFELNLTDKSMLSKFTFDIAGYVKVETEITDKIVVKLVGETIIRLGAVSTVSTDNKPLYYVYSGNKGCVIDSVGMSEISLDWIEKIEILKDASATALYGSRGAHGVIRIEIKKAYKKKINFSKYK